MDEQQDAASPENGTAEGLKGYRGFLASMSREQLAAVVPAVCAAPEVSGRPEARCRSEFGELWRQAVRVITRAVGWAGLEPKAVLARETAIEQQPGRDTLPRRNGCDNFGTAIKLATAGSLLCLICY